MLKIKQIVVFLLSLWLIWSVSGQTMTAGGNYGTNAYGTSIAITEDGEIAVTAAAVIGYDTSKTQSIVTSADDSDGASTSQSTDVSGETIIAVSSASDSSGNTAVTEMIATGDASLITEQGAEAQNGVSTDAGQQTVVTADNAIASTVAVGDEGTAEATTVVEDGNLATGQSVSTTGGAGQTSTVEGARGSATVTAADNTGATAIASASFEDGTLDTRQDAVVSDDGGVSVTQHAAASGAEATVTSTSTATNGDTATASAEVTNGKITTDVQNAGNSGTEDSYAGNVDTVVTGDSGSASVTATAADGATASASAIIVNGEVVADQFASATGEAEVSQNVAARGDNAAATVAAEDGQGNLLEVNAEVTSGTINAGQSATADPVSGANGGQSTTISADFGIVTTVASNEEGIASVTTLVYDGTLTTGQSAGATGTIVNAGQTSEATGTTASAYTTASNEGGSAGATIIVERGSFVTDQSAGATGTIVDAGQTSEATGFEATSDTSASSDEGTASATTRVTDGTLVTDQSASTNRGAGAPVAGQSSTVEGAQGYATVLAADNTGATAEGKASVVDGTIDTNQQAIIYTDFGVRVNQQTTAEGAGVTVTSTSTATNGDTATASVEVTNGQMTVGNQIAGNCGAGDAYADNYNAVITGESGSVSVSAESADGAQASSTSRMTGGEIIAEQSGEASGFASAGQNTVASGIFADTSSTANDGLGNSAFVLSSVNNGVINADQSITADPVTGIAGRQETFVVAQDGIGLVAAQGYSGVSSNDARVQASVTDGNIEATQNVGNNVKEPNDTFVDQTASLDVYNGSGETSSITESDGRLVSIQNGVSGSHMDSTYQAYSSDVVNTLEFQESNDHTTSGGTSNFAAEIRNSINGDKFDTSGFSEVIGWGNVSNDDLLFCVYFKG